MVNECRLPRERSENYIINSLSFLVFQDQSRARKRIRGRTLTGKFLPIQLCAFQGLTLNSPVRVLSLWDVSFRRETFSEKAFSREIQARTSRTLEVLRFPAPITEMNEWCSWVMGLPTWWWCEMQWALGRVIRHTAPTGCVHIERFV